MRHQVQRKVKLNDSREVREAWPWAALHGMSYSIIPEPKNNEEQGPFQGINNLTLFKVRKQR